MLKKISLLILLVANMSISLWAQELPELPRENVNFILISDSGMKKESQRAIVSGVADQMKKIIDNNKIQFVAVAGDPIHNNGVTSVSDPEWKFKVEDIFKDKSLHSIPWHAVPGNHEYKGNPQAIVDYSKVSDRWETPSKYYTIDKRVKKSKVKVHFTFLDTSPLIDMRMKLYKGMIEDSYPQKELEWFDSTMTASNAKWNIVIGHQPVYADTQKDISERNDMQNRLNPLLIKHSADVYVCGHIHSFQHIIVEGCNINYIVNSSAGTYRDVSPIDGTMFCANQPGFTLFSVGEDTIDFYFINNKGEVLYHYTINKQ